MHKLRQTEAGYSLIQIAIGMVVLGIFIAAAGHSFILYKRDKDLRTTMQNLETVREALQGFRQNFGFFPCPSSISAQRDQAAYGVATDCNIKTQPIGNCDDGICIEEAVDGNPYTISNGQIINPPPPARVLADTRVRVGAIPFRSLQIDERVTFDAYGSRLVYALTESMGNAGTFREGSGAIHVVNSRGESLVEPAGSAPFIIISPGPNKLGAYSQDGAQSSPCAGAVLDAENCRDFNPIVIPGGPPPPPGSPEPFALYVADYRSDAGINNSFDDFVEYFAKAEVPKWQRTNANIENIQSLVDDSVGIDIADPEDALEIPLATTFFDDDNDPTTPAVTERGALRATDEIRAQEICDLEDTNCFDPEVLAGPTGISCPNPGEYMVGIADSAALCAPVRIYCEDDNFPILTGVDASGEPECIARPLMACNAAVQLCSGAPLTPNRRNSDQAGITRPLTAVGNHGQTVMVTDTLSYGANPRRSNFTCDNGVWRHNGSPQLGLCSCTPPPALTRTVAVACPGQSPSGNAAVQNQTWNATTCNWQNNGGVDYTACACPGPATAKPADTTSSCGAGYNSGNNTTTYTFNNARNVCDWQGSTTDNCTCDPAVAGAKPPKYERTLTTPVACNAVPGYSTYTGNAYKIQKFDYTAGVCKWKDIDWDTNDCKCDTTTEYPAAAPPSPCTACQEETKAAVWVFKYEISKGECVPGPAKKKSDAVCQNISFRWRSASATPLGPPGASAGTRPEVGSSCDCADRGTTKTCYSQTSPGVYYYYNCTCNR